MLLPVLVFVFAFLSIAMLAVLSQSALRAAHITRDPARFRRVSASYKRNSHGIDTSFNSVVNDPSSVSTLSYRPHLPHLAVESHTVGNNQRPFRRKRHNFLAPFLDKEYVSHAKANEAAARFVLNLFDSSKLHSDAVHSRNASFYPIRDKSKLELAQSSRIGRFSVTLSSGVRLPAVDDVNTVSTFAVLKNSTKAEDIVSAALVNTFKFPRPVAQVMPLEQAYELLWKLSYLQALRPAYPARALLLHVQNGLANRLRAVAGGIALAKMTARVPVVIWQLDAHLSASYDDLFVREQMSTNFDPRQAFLMSSTLPDRRYSGTVRTLGVIDGDDVLEQYSAAILDEQSEAFLYRNFIVLDKFLRWDDVPKWSSNWSPLNQMQKETVKKHRALFLTQKWPSKKTRKDKTSPDHHVYVKTAYTLVTKPVRLLYSEDLNALIRRMVPAPNVQALLSADFIAYLHTAIGVHIRSRSITNDNVDVNASCEYTVDGADITNFWRSQSQLPFFAAKMSKYIRRSRESSFFVATDDVSVLHKLKARFAGHILHLPRTCDDRGPECVRYALADLMCLARTEKLLGSQWSSFTEVAERVSGSPLLLSGINFGRPRILVVLQSLWRAITSWWRSPDRSNPFYKCF